jgi:hypothetical protein
MAASASVAIVVGATAHVFGPGRAQPGRTYRFGTPCRERVDERPPPRRLPNAPGFGWLAWSGGDVLAAEAGTDLTPLASDTCHLLVTFTRGAAWIEARDMGGGDLRLTTKHGELHAEGPPPSSDPASAYATPIRFAVTLRDAGLRVAVASGRVTLRRSGALPVSLGPREGAQVVNGATEVGSASEAELGPLRLAFLQHAVPRASHTPPSGPNLRAAPPATTTPPRAPTRPSLPSILPAEPPLEAPPPEQLPDLLLDAELAQQQGRREVARRLLGRVALGSGPVADTAALRLVRMDLDEGRLSEAASALSERQRRLTGPLATEGAWLGVSLQKLLGNTLAARKQATELVRRWPTSPQATAARALLE